jgi:IS1 family transposase
VRLGGPGSVVEIDESLFIRVKHHRGKDIYREQLWVFGLYDTDTQNIVFEIVPSRDAKTLLNVINNYCLDKTVVYSDCWAAYNHIQDLNFSYKQVNHTYTFSSKNVHTN